MKSMAKPIIVLTLICLITSLLLAAVNSITKPIIEAYEAKEAARACLEVMPEGIDFTETELKDTFPASVKAVYREAGGGYVFKMVTTGFNSGYQIMCGISPEGKITGTCVLSHSETQGYGSRTAEKAYNDLYIGEDSSMSLNGKDYLLSGATKSSKAYRTAIADAFSAYAIVTGEG